MQPPTHITDRLNRLKSFLADASLDGLITLAAYMAVLVLLPHRFSEHPEANVQFILLAAVVLITALYSFKVYNRLWQRTSGHSVMIIVEAVAIATVILLIVALLISPRLLTIGVVMLANLFALIGFVVVRYRSRLISGLIIRYQYWTKQREQVSLPVRTRVLIVGAGESGQMMALRMQHGLLSQRYQVVGFIDDDPRKQGMILESRHIFGGRERIPAVVEAQAVDLIVVAIHNISGVQFRDILHHCEKTNARIKIVPDVLRELIAPDHTTLLRDVQAEDLLGRGPITRHEAIDLAPVTGKRILITGAAGSIGSELSRQIFSYQPECVVLLDNNESGLYDLMMDLTAAHPQAVIIPALVDVTLRENVKQVYEQHRPHIVFHAAAYKHVPMLQTYATEAIRVNVGGTRNIAELACTYSVERFVLISTDKAVNPSSVMGATKRLCELMLHALASEQSSTIFTAVRFGNVLGSRGSVVPTFTRQIEQGGPVTVTHPDMTRYFMSIPEAVNLIVHAAAISPGDDIYILKMGEVVRIVELAERLIRLRGLRPYRDIPIVFTGIREGEKMHEELFTLQDKPLATIHPGIIKLNTWPASFDRAQFWRKLEALPRQPGDDTDLVFDQLKSIAMSTPAPANRPA